MFFLKVIRIVVRKKKTNIKPVELENNNKRRKEVNKDTLSMLKVKGLSSFISAFCQRIGLVFTGNPEKGMLKGCRELF